MARNATSASASPSRRSSSNSMQSRTRGPSGSRKMSSARRSPWPSTPAVADAPLEQRPAPRQVPRRQRVHLQHVVHLDHALPDGEQAGGVGRPAPGQRLPPGCTVGRGAAIGPGVEGGDQPGQAPQLGVEVGTRGHERRESPVVGHAPHHDQVIAHAAVRPDDVGHAQVDVGGQPPVELHLPGADIRPRLTATEVEESEIDWLLELERPVPDEHDDRGVRLRHGRRPEPIDRRRCCLHDHPSCLD